MWLQQECYNQVGAENMKRPNFQRVNINIILEKESRIKSAVRKYKLKQIR